jgi:oligosaccharide repeat unit polymerase
MEYVDQQTYNLMLYSTIIFICVEYLVKAFSKASSLRLAGRPVAPMTSAVEKERKPFNISSSVLLITIFLTLLGLSWSALLIVKFGGANLNEMMAHYKDAYNTNASEIGGGFPILSQLNKILTVLNYIFLYVYIYNRSIEKMEKRKGHLYWISFLLYILFRLIFSAGRQTTIFFLMAALTCFYICNVQKINKKIAHKGKKKFLRIMITAMIIIIPTFYIVGRFVGRKTSSTLYDAAFSYLACGLYYLNIIIHNHYISAYGGQISFSGLYPYLSTLGLIPQNAKPMSFLPFCGHGNTVTLLGRWYWDYGNTGVYIMVGIVSAMFSILYYNHVKCSTAIKPKHLSTIYYIFLVHILYFAGYDDFSFNIWTVNYFVIFILFYIFDHFLLKDTKRLQPKLSRKYASKYIK